MKRLATRRLVVGVALIAIASLGLGACGGKGPGPSTTEWETLEPPVDKNAPPPVPPAWPLTGETGTVEVRPALALKIENSSGARPQEGLEFADVVWEEIVEGGISRFVVVFNSQIPQEAGPVRSVRPMDGPIMGPTHGLLAFSGGQPRFVETAREAGLQVISDDGGDPGFFKSNSRKAPHNLYANVPDLFAQADPDHSALPAEEFTFAGSPETATAASAGEGAARVAFNMSGEAKPAWDWDPERGAWLRSEGSKEAVVASGERITATNVIGIKVELRNTGTSDAAGNPVPESVVVGTGEGVIATGGKAIAVTWSKESATAPMVLTTADGGAVTLAPGRTWIELVPQRDGTWSLS